MFEVSGYVCAFPVESVREVIHVTATLTAPAQPSMLEGFLNYHGQPVPVIVLARLFGLPETEGDLYSPIILIQERGEILGIVVDSVEGVATIAGEEMRQLPADHSLNNCAEAQFVYEGRPVTLLASSRVLLDKERQCIAGLAEQARRRLQNLELNRS